MNNLRRTITEAELTKPLMPFSEAREITRMATHCSPVSTVPVQVALGQVLATTVRSPIDVPSFENSAMDGYAILSERTMQAASASPVAIDSSVRIPTGAPIPNGFDAIVPWEATTRTGPNVYITKPVKPKANVREQGADARAGDVVLEKDTYISPLHVGVLSSLGITHIETYAPPRVSVASSGNEIATPGDELKPGNVYDSNRFLVKASVESAGCRVVQSSLLRDDPTHIEQWLDAAVEESEFIVTSGGASVGERDWIRTVVEAHGEMLFWHVAIKPGKPVGLARINNTLVFILPGNPGATFVCTQALVVPALMAAMGRSFYTNYFEAILTESILAPRERSLICPAIRTNGRVKPLPPRPSQLLTPFLEANALTIVPPGGIDTGSITENIEVIK